MRKHHFITAAIAAAILATPAERAEADAGDFVAGAIIGGVLGHAVRNQPRKQVYRSTKSAPKKVYRSKIPATQEGRQIQSSLNYFGFNAGSVDGQLGRKSRDAISAYQAYLGYPVTGQLNTFERDLLVNSYNRAQAGGYATQQQIAATAEGTRGLLKQYRAEMAGGPFAQPGTTMVMAPQPVAPQPMPAQPMVVQPQVPQAPTVMAAAAPVVQPLPALPVPVAAAPQVAKATAAPLPSLFAAAPAVPLSQTCDGLGIQAASRFEFASADALADTDAALTEQFCVARGYAIETARELGQSIGASGDKVAQLCSVYGERLQPYVTALGAQSSDQVLDQVSAFVADAGIPEAQLSGTAQVCLGEGYASDDMGLALGSGLLLVALGQSAYGELMGHHLHRGAGVAANPGRAKDWFDMGLSAAEAGDPVFAPSQPERLTVLRRVLFPSSSASIPASSQVLPTFAISQ
ncbi:peptidoglycan-binding protein [Maribius pontilimi]|uniref:Peptidoglycan-binding protein n=1 Tax=Palleronia pontilimi TaxID=1964209 RepID=A0A934M895_9RHOB|nr:peptidoglycan-binding domain-containing protein [Palleronia pontilimi]MBJ3761147.1 peptidoglycan-binding protein [Palleronia pontilimi]